MDELMTYQIKNWCDEYENSRSKSIKDCQWTPIPNKQSGLGYKKLLTGHKNGPAHYGAWMAIVLRCSQQPDRDGWLTDGGKKDDTAWTVDDLELMTSIPAKVFEEALPRLVEIGWMLDSLVVMAIKGNGVATALPRGAFLLPPNRIEENRIEGIEKKNTFDQNEFDRFWTIYPRKVGKQKCEAFFRSHKPDNIDQMIQTIEAFKLTDQWQDSTLIPHPFTWLNRGGWDDEVDLPTLSDEDRDEQKRIDRAAQDAREASAQRIEDEKTRQHNLTPEGILEQQTAADDAYEILGKPRKHGTVRVA